MLEAVITDIFGVKSCRMSGRLDSLTANEAQGILDNLVTSGQRTIIIDLEELRYVSSAGLRVLTMFQKLLKKVGGGLIIFRPTSGVQQIFELSGFTNIFDIFSNPKDLAAFFAADQGGPTSHFRKIDGITFETIERPVESGSFLAYGSSVKVAKSEYKANDVVTVSASGPVFGAGLGAFGDNYDEYRDFFGEAVIINGSLFYHPAMRGAAVDFVLNLQKTTEFNYKFLHAFGFTGEFKTICAFESQDGFIDLSRLMAALSQFYPYNCLGVVLLAESKGLWGMNLKKTPILENKPDRDREIFHPDLFKDWMNFPVEPGDFGHIITGAGLIVPDRPKASPRFKPWLPPDSPFHFHAGVFSKGPLNKKPEQFEEELERVITKLEVYKVQH
ncbi:MAG: STAS domain-containing protein, partial [Deltaproteobacteria bacterium]|nr:STAS domain-containing protein [Deltaproteobacteria bacterium]